MYWLIFFISIAGTCIAGKRYVAPARKDKVGVELTLSDLYHPWSDDAKPQAAPMSDQHRISEYLMTTLREGDSIDRAISLFESYSSSNNLGMSLGDPKGKVIEKSFSKLVVPQDIVVVEFGSHIGDGTLRMIRQLVKNKDHQVTIFSLEANPEWLSIGQVLFGMYSRCLG